MEILMKNEFHLDHIFQPKNKIIKFIFSFALLFTFKTSLLDGFDDFLFDITFLFCEDDVSIFNAIRLCFPIDSGNKQYHLYFDEV